MACIYRQNDCVMPMASRFVCKVIGCLVTKHEARGYCLIHYGFLMRRGDANAPRINGIRGEGTITETGYRAHTVNGRPKYEHIMVAEKALGRPLPRGAQVHHVNEIKTDNRGSNLVICPNSAYHRLLHKRADAYDACGHADWLKCGYCGKHDAPGSLTFIDRGPRHKACAKAYSVANRKHLNEVRLQSACYERQKAKKKERNRLKRENRVLTTT